MAPPAGPVPFNSLCTLETVNSWTVGMSASALVSVWAVDGTAARPAASRITPWLSEKSSVDVPVVNRSREGATRLVEDESTLLGLGDSGAHVMSVTNYRYPSFMLGELVRDRGELQRRARKHV